MATIKVDDKFSPEDVKRGLELLEKAKIQKEKDKVRNSDPKVKEALKAAEAKRQAVIKITLQKAKAAGITVSDKEVADFVAAKAKK